MASAATTINTVNPTKISTAAEDGGEAVADVCVVELFGGPRPHEKQRATKNTDNNVQWVNLVSIAEKSAVHILSSWVDKRDSRMRHQHARGGDLLPT